MNLLSYLAEHFDLPILDWIAAHLHCGFLDRVMPVITAFGNGHVVAVLAFGDPSVTAATSDEGHRGDQRQGCDQQQIQ